MITEDYVSYEVAKLLKEKGFDSWQGNGGDIDGSWYCTQALAMKWLREKGLFIEVVMFTLAGEIYYSSNIISTHDAHYISNGYAKRCPTYEEAVEAALKYCLTNLM